MSAAYFLDTGIANLIARKNPQVLRLERSAAGMYVPSLVLGELYFGAYLHAHKHHSTKYFDMYDEFRALYSDAILTPDADTAHFYAAIRAELTVHGMPIRHTDLWIAALARQHDLTVATTDGDYARISNLLRDLALKPPSGCKTGPPSRVLQA